MTRARHPHASHPDEPQASSASDDEFQVRDEVCGMTFPQRQAASRIMVGDQAYYFCSSHCRDKFREHPGWYVPGA
jgi:Cu+-exporting ATPase